MNTLHLKWIIAHQPVYLFQRVAEDFKRLVNERSQSVKIDIEILTNEEYNAKYQPAEPATRHNLWKFLQDNTVQIAQMQTTSLARQANQQMHVLSMPYLFEDHDHAAKVLEGPVGQRLLNSFDTNSKLKGLAYTYSGGFMMFPVKGSVTSLADIVGQQVRSRMSHVSQETLKSFGMIPVPTEIDEVSDAVMSGDVVAAEHVAQRLLPDNCDSWVNTIIDTQHSLFLTSIVVNVDWWNSLDDEVQQIFNDAAVQAARNERALSLEDGAASLKKLETNGVKVINLDQTELNILREKSESVYQKYQDYFEPGLVDSIRKIQ